MLPYRQRYRLLNGFLQRLLVDGEDSESFSKDVERVFQRLHRLRELDGFVLVFTHGHVIRCLLGLLLFNIRTVEEAKMEIYSQLRQSL